MQALPLDKIVSCARLPRFIAQCGVEVVEPKIPQRWLAQLALNLPPLPGPFVRSEDVAGMLLLLLKVPAVVVNHDDPDVEPMFQDERLRFRALTKAERVSSAMTEPRVSARAGLQVLERPEDGLKYTSLSLGTVHSFRTGKAEDRPRLEAELHPGKYMFIADVYRRMHADPAFAQQAHTVIELAGDAKFWSSMVALWRANPPEVGEVVP